IVEGACVSPEGRGAPRQLMIHTDQYIDGLTELAEEIHREDAKVILQLVHMGRMAISQLNGLKSVAPSPIPSLNKKDEFPDELTTEQVANLVEAFVRGAQRAEQAGFDGVEIHGAHGYLITSFLSSLSNNRTDRYGGSLESRCRFLLEIVQGIKKRVTQPDFI